MTHQATRSPLPHFVLGCVAAAVITVTLSNSRLGIAQSTEQKGDGLLKRVAALESQLDGVQSISVGVVDVEHGKFLNPTGLFQSAQVDNSHGGSVYIKGLPNFDPAKAVVVVTPQGGKAEPYLMTVARATTGQIVIITSKPNDAAAGLPAGSHQEQAGILNIVLVITR
jgi:hypothetical protein